MDSGDPASRPPFHCREPRRSVGSIAALEDRARALTYRAMFRTLIDTIAPRPGEAILDVGCGAGSLDRLLAHRLGGANPITAIDMNPFYLKEAGALVAEDGLTGGIRFLPGSAEALPFPDAAFDAIFSVTVLEECDADGAIAEMWRVVVPGGRIGIIVRSLDLPQWWNLDLPEPIRTRSPRHRDRLPPRASPMPAFTAGCGGPGWAISSASRPCSRSTGRKGRSGALAKIMRSPCLPRRNGRSGMPPATRRSKTGLLMTSWPFHCAVGTKAGAAQR